MDVQKKIDEIVQAVGSARSMPMSASCVVNRADLLSMLEEVRQALPGSLAQAQELIGGREQLVEQARQEAERIIEGAHAERGSLISDTEVARRSQAEADRILAEARQAAEEVRAEADDYVDSKLANFEVVLTKTLGSVGRGREKLLGTGPGVDERGYEDEDAPERSHDPETLRRDADAYVDAKLGSFEAVLAKTLEAVGKGRRTLHGHAPADELGTLGEGGGPQGHTTDAEYLADLAGTPLTAPPGSRQRRPRSPPCPSRPRRSRRRSRTRSRSSSRTPTRTSTRTRTRTSSSPTASRTRTRTSIRTCNSSSTSTATRRTRSSPTSRPSSLSSPSRPTSPSTRPRGRWRRPASSTPP
ncbi:hypothetical protein SALBM135S_09186 [Streptomyces alboniger]